MTQYNIYHNTYSGAIQEVIRFVNHNQYELDNDQVFQITGIDNSRPKNGQTTRFSLYIYKNGVKNKKCVHVQVFNRGTNTNNYELNMYIL